MTIRKQTQTILASAVRTATPPTVTLRAEEVIASTFVVEVTATAVTPTITILIEGKDPVSGAFYTILTSAGITSVSTNVLQIGKDIVAAANVAANQFLPSEYRVTSTHSDSDSITYSIGVTHMVDI